MAAYAALAFLSFLWGSSFLLIKIASRAFDPFDFALARVGVAAAAMLLTSAAFGQGLAWVAAGTMGQAARARADRAGRSLHSACKGRDADHERRHGVDDGRAAYLRLPVRPISRIARPMDLARGSWPRGRLRRGRRRVLVAGSGERRAFRPGTGLRSGRGRRLRNGSDHLGRGDERDRRGQSGNRLDDALDACACAGRARVREASAARSGLPDSARARARNGRARRLQHGARLLCLFPAGPRRGARPSPASTTTSRP